MRQVLSTALVALVVAAVTAVTVSAVAQSEPEAVMPAAVSNVNAHRVDGKHAVGAGATKAQRAGKLVATNADGELPSNIIKPDWSLIQNLPTGFADGTDGVGYFSNVQFTQTTPLAPGAQENLFTFNWPASWSILWEVIPTNTGAGTEKLLLTERAERQGNGNLQYWLTVRNDGDVASAYRLRYVAFYLSIAPASASAKRKLADVGVRVREGR